MIVYLISDDLKMHELLAGGLKEKTTGIFSIVAVFISVTSGFSGRRRRLMAA